MNRGFREFDWLVVRLRRKNGKWRQDSSSPRPRKSRRFRLTKTPEEALGRREPFGYRHPQLICSLHLFSRLQDGNLAGDPTHLYLLFSSRSLHWETWLSAYLKPALHGSRHGPDTIDMVRSFYRTGAIFAGIPTGLPTKAHRAVAGEIGQGAGGPRRGGWWMRPLWEHFVPHEEPHFRDFFDFVEIALLPACKRLKLGGAVHSVRRDDGRESGSALCR